MTLQFRAELCENPFDEAFLTRGKVCCYLKDSLKLAANFAERKFLKL